MIELQSLSKTYRTADREIVALEDISLTVRDGEIFGIIGLSGAGKSTLVRCINLLERPTSGRVLIDGREITALPRKQLLKLRQSIGMIFQGFNLLEQRTVLHNVTFPLEVSGLRRSEAKARATELLELVGLSDRADSYPSQLSGGQKQRVAIARALATNPKYLLCDEATSALDPNTTRSILELLAEINKQMGVTIVIITHEMKVIDRICDRVAVLDQSRVVEEGAVSEVFTNPRSTIAKELILPDSRVGISAPGGRRIRLTFHAGISQEPLLSRMILECQCPVNILFAETKQLDTRTYGQMLIELPTEPRDAERIIAWLKNSPLDWQEEE
ncbi:MAG: ATP-binding cassette domain-containing protein [Ruminococcaceae bacterium]|nr:ATP-binding cassette domain-containing protein [Oscillospiraceae bacterium]